MSVVTDLKTRMRQLFCRHEYEEKTLNGFRVVDGWFRRVTVLECRKCGKMKC